jgi:hypothetical protein
MEADYLKYFKTLEISIQNHEILTIKKLSSIIDKNFLFSKQLLYEYIISRKALDNLIIFFVVQINDNNCLKSILVPSYSQVLDSLLNNFEVFDLYVYAVFKKETDFDFKDFSVFIEQNDIQINFINDGSAFIKTVSNITLNNETIPTKINGNTTQPNAPVTSVVKEDPQPKVIKPILKTKDKIHTTNVTKTTQEKIVFPSSSQQINIPKTAVIKTNSNYEEVESLDHKEKVLLNFENNFKLNEEDHGQEEEYFYGGKVTINSKSQPEVTSISNKRKASPNPDEKNEKRKKEEVKPRAESSDSENNNNSNNGKNKVKKIRKVLKTTYAQDEKGYLNSIDEYVDEEYWSDELKPAPKKVVAVEDKKTKGKKTNTGQGNILNFFGKK